MRRKLLCAVGATALFASLASAQTAPQADKDAASNPALKHTDVKNTKDPAEGANSFTEAQARARISKAGYSHISALKKDDGGLWQGTAMKNGKSVQVALDYKGNVSAK
jgi:hypothetical protein